MLKAIDSRFSVRLTGSDSIILWFLISESNSCPDIKVLSSKILSLNISIRSLIKFKLLTM